MTRGENGNGADRLTPRNWNEPLKKKPDEAGMPGLVRLVPGIHVFAVTRKKGVDGRDIGQRKRRHPLDGYARS